MRASQVIQRLRALSRKVRGESRGDRPRAADRRDGRAPPGRPRAIKRITILTSPARRPAAARVGRSHPDAAGPAQRPRQAPARPSPPSRTAPEIVIETTVDQPGFVCVCVRDTGAGVAEAALEQIFQPFVTSKREGLGMGLDQPHDRGGAPGADLGDRPASRGAPRSTSRCRCISFMGASTRPPNPRVASGRPGEAVARPSDGRRDAGVSGCAAAQRGSSASPRSPSPTRLKAEHREHDGQARARWPRAAPPAARRDRSRPSGPTTRWRGCTPSPRNDSAASRQDRVGHEERGVDDQPGRRCWAGCGGASEAGAGAPSARAAPTYSVSRRASTEPRTIRRHRRYAPDADGDRGVEAPGPSAATMARASSR